MSPTLDPRRFVFATGSTAEASPHLANALMVFRENEGVTLILEAEVASRTGLRAEFPCRMITLNIHSDLAAVGFLARIVPELAALGMGVNPVSAFYHDHLFIPEDRAEDALAALIALATK